MSAPTTFEAHGHTWTKYTPGDPMPCGRWDEILTLFRDGSFHPNPATRNVFDPTWKHVANDVYWGIRKKGSEGKEIIGWRFADPPQKKDELTVHERQSNAIMDLAAKLGVKEAELFTLREENAGLIKQQDAAREDARRLAYTVRRFASHDSDCSCRKGRVCSCGLTDDKALAAHEALTAKN